MAIFSLNTPKVDHRWGPNDTQIKNLTSHNLIKFGSSRVDCGSFWYNNCSKMLSLCKHLKDIQVLHEVCMVHAMFCHSTEMVEAAPQLHGYVNSCQYTVSNLPLHGRIDILNLWPLPTTTWPPPLHTTNHLYPYLTPTHPHPYLPLQQFFKANYHMSLGPYELRSSWTYFLPEYAVWRKI